MGLNLPDNCVEALNAVGFNWPSTDEDVLRDWGTKLDAIATDTSDRVPKVDGHYTAVKNANTGPGVDAFAGYVQHNDSALAVMRDFGSLSSGLATAARVVADLVMVMKGAVIGQLLILAGSLFAAGVTCGALSFGVALAKEACRRAIEALINVLIEKVLAEA